VNDKTEMILVIGNETKVSNDKRPASTGARGTGVRSCRCGQQLDVCARQHCPRCGRTLNR
jgi:hypothetical protein